MKLSRKLGGGVVSGMAAVRVRNIYFILYPNTPGGGAPLISITGADTTP